jgi:hypothetical protein
MKRWIERTKSLVIGSISAEDTNGWPPVIAEEVGDAVGEHEPGHIQVRVHAVNALQLPHDVVGENVAGTAG